MNNWQVGDLARAVGVKREDWPNGKFPEGFTADGKIYRVDAVNCILGVVGLRFDEFPSPATHRYWHSASFRKIKPDEANACEAAFVTLLNRSKQSTRGAGDANNAPASNHGD